MVPSCTSALVVAREGEGGAALRGRRCKTPHSRAVVAVEQPAAPGGDWYPANPSHNDDHPTCCICMTSVDPAGARRLPCSHAFHPECLARCLQHSALCPLCKVPVE